MKLKMRNMRLRKLKWICVKQRFRKIKCDKCIEEIEEIKIT